MKDKIIEFQFDDISDDIEFEGCDDVVTEEFMTNLLNKVRSQKWFIEGNKTQGTITFISDIEFKIDWVENNMGEDWDSDEEIEHTQKVLVNMDNTEYEVIEW